jgi:hypothetical protein
LTCSAGAGNAAKPSEGAVEDRRAAVSLDGAHGFDGRGDRGQVVSDAVVPVDRHAAALTIAVLPVDGDARIQVRMSPERAYGRPSARSFRSLEMMTFQLGTPIALSSRSTRFVPSPILDALRRLVVLRLPSSPTQPPTPLRNFAARADL